MGVGNDKKGVTPMSDDRIDELMDIAMRMFSLLAAREAAEEADDVQNWIEDRHIVQVDFSALLARIKEQERKKEGDETGADL